MVSRRPASVIAALSATVALVGVPAASAQPPGPAVRGVVTELPVLSELPPLPTEGGQPVVDEPEGTGVFGMSGVQTVALVLAASVLVAGGTGLALVTRRGRGEPLDEQPPRTDPVA
ncbi:MULTISPECIES: hypothetical protein [Dietzia]|uniref:Uncharacterized protein n=1 Tax=Dietzia cinnamea TaxID=321318 RepID=A0AAW5Q5S9_9ACTN|nr:MULTISPECIES: hypothetical protein [Dietzia]EFV92979.1 hypothetical protein ES5_03151 [Dietzia cinnamea P4]KZO59724.1 hypothetical protein A2U19_05345 [Dietzia maris]MBM7230707.1 hypothetical protein [Dietzia cinnamea]MCT1863824.1 hypothetical protein [Dietzia cinnamea]MCT2030109.1 hypothetical protein [Dietzia cinnamea]